MKQCLIAVSLALASIAAHAQTTAANHDAHHAGAKAEGELTEGEVRRVDREQNKITLRHGEIKSPEMPAMTMVFAVRDGKLLDAVKTGDKVLFRVIKEPNGALVVTDLKPAP